MSKKAKNEVGEKSAAVITDAVLAENDKKLKELSASIQNALKRKQKIIKDCKLYTYGQLSELYGGIEGQELLDAVTAEHTLIGKSHLEYNAKVISAVTGESQTSAI